MDDQVFEALADERRRRVLQTLDASSPAELPLQVPEDVADGEVDLDRLQASYHSHLPKLASLAYVEWDPQGGTVTPGANFDEVRPLLRFLGDGNATK